MLTLQVPRTDETVSKFTAETNPKATAAWLARLPFGSPVDVARQLVGALYALNRRPLDPLKRYALQSLYRPAVANAAASLERLLAESGVPPHEQQRQMGMLLRELLTEYSIGYKHILLSVEGSAGRGLQPRRFAEVVAWLLASLRDLQLACHCTYSPLPAGLWLETHQLYLLAKSSGAADKAMGAAPPASLAYRQALLLALADPPQMSRAELAHTRLLLGKLGGLAVLGPATGDATQAGFAIATDSDRGPRPAGNQNKGELWLDTDALCRQLRDIALRLRSGDSPRQIGLPQEMESGLSLTLGKRLLKLWHTGAQRRSKRYAAAAGTVQVVAGVSSIHRMLEAGEPQSGEPGAEPDNSLPIHDVDPMFAAPATVSTSHWTISNDSAAGLALSGAPGEPLNLKVGDALALRTDDAAAWSLAVIRWIRMRDALRIELGVERLSPQMQPVWVRPLRGRRKGRSEPALFVPGSPALKQPDRLLLPRTLYHAGMDAEVWRPQQQTTLSFGRRLEHTPSFDLIDFTVIANETTHD
jgi:cyclic-di-GMP-binding protein